MSIVSTMSNVVQLLLDATAPTGGGGAGGSGGNGPPPWVLIALGGLTILYLAFIRPMRKGKKKPDPLERPAVRLSLAQQRAVEREMGNLLVEYEEMIRRMTAQVETRSAKLELLIREADEKIAALRAAAGGGDPGADGVPAKPRAEDVPPAAGTVAENQPVPALPAPAPADPAADAPAPPDARHTEVYRLADKGRSAGQIAAELDRPHGEIELILALRTANP
jgi:hypothetical protein